MIDAQYNKRVSFYKRYEDKNNQVAISFKYADFNKNKDGPKKIFFVIEMAPKIPNTTKYDWDQRIYMNMTKYDLGDFLAVLYKYVPEIEIPHNIVYEGMSTYTVFSAKWAKDEGKTVMNIELNYNNEKKLQYQFNVGNIALIRVFAEEIIRYMVNTKE